MKHTRRAIVTLADFRGRLLITLTLRLFATTDAINGTAEDAVLDTLDIVIARVAFESLIGGSLRADVMHAAT